MANPSLPRELLQGGIKCNVVYAQAADESRPAKVFFESLEIKDQVKFANLFATIGEHGKISNTEHFRPSLSKIVCQIGDIKRKVAIAEFKIHSGCGQRILAYQDDRQWVLVSGFPKGSKVEAELKRAHRIICEDLQRKSPRAE